MLELINLVRGELCVIFRLEYAHFHSSGHSSYLECTAFYWVYITCEFRKCAALFFVLKCCPYEVATSSPAHCLFILAYLTHEFPVSFMCKGAHLKISLFTQSPLKVHTEKVLLLTTNFWCCNILCWPSGAGWCMMLVLEP